MAHQKCVSWWEWAVLVGAVDDGDEFATVRRRRLRFASASLLQEVRE
jgi:hypothetical protein